MIRNFDFQCWANLCIFSNECFRFWSFIISTRRIFSTWISASQSCQRHRKLYSIKSLFEFSWCCCTEVPRAPTLNISDLVRIDTSEGATLDSESPFHFSCTADRKICNLQSKFLTTTRHCAVETELIDGNDDAKQLLSLDPHCSVSISVHLLCFSKLLETTHWFLWKEDVRFSLKLIIISSCEGWEVPPMSHAQVDPDRRRVQAHREEDPRKVS